MRIDTVFIEADKKKLEKDKNIKWQKQTKFLFPR